MPKKKPAQSDTTPSTAIHPLAQRVQARMAEVGLALDQRARASRPRAKRAKPPKTDLSLATKPLTPSPTL
jgi:hypothetical protein